MLFSKSFRLQPEGWPCDSRAQRLFIIDQYRVRATLSYEGFFVFPVDFLPFFGRRPLPDRLRSLIEHAPATALLDTKLLEIRPGRKRQLFDSEMSLGAD